MDGLVLNSIPRLLLARIILQLFVIPQSLLDNEKFNLITVLLAGLQQYGETSDLNALLSFCLERSLAATSGADQEEMDGWWWKDQTVWDLDDWRRLDSGFPRDKSEPIGLHVQIMCEEAREGIELVRYGQEAARYRDSRFYYPHKGRLYRIDTLLHGTAAYLLESQTGPPHEALARLLQSRLEQYARDQYEEQQELPHKTDYILMGALMTRYDSLQTNGFGEQKWCLYMRDYIASNTGSIWRILSGQSSDESQQRVTCFQALADIRGIPIAFDDQNRLEPSSASRDYRPVYLFYSNQDLVINTVHEIQSPKLESEQDDRVITLADYSFDDDGRDMLSEEYSYEQDTYDDDTVCKHCGIAEIVKDVNNMFFCDECNEGVHQLCEDPPIEPYEKDIDPWYCRECLRRKGLPLPRPPFMTDEYTTGTKRKREE